ncbi:hypothetical protein K440DRAFT_684722 [Wilcoxina mikolae CBS 423.85]|nr:hypothetical protein K440DRAFT_684722 [Wilcoxina mikolae CBS 423.85]
MNPYEADPAKIPADDLYADLPFYGRYLPRSDDFTPDSKYINPTTPESITYWKNALNLCDESVRLYENQDGGRDVFALGSIIVKSSHMKSSWISEVSKFRRYISLGRAKGFFQSTSSGYPSPRKNSPVALSEPSHVNPDPDPVSHRGTQQPERELLFDGKDLDLGLMHNDLQRSNIIVDKDKIVAVVDWEMAGYFGWKRAAAVYVQIRSPRREDYAHLNLDKKFLDDILFWNDLYETDRDV